MIFDSSWRLDWQRERTIRGILRRLARQRVMLAPDGVWIIERGISRGDHETESALATCSMRGWVELLHDNVPLGRFEGLNAPARFQITGPVYRLTDTGWNVIYRRRLFDLVIFGLTAIGVFLALLALL